MSKNEQIMQSISRVLSSARLPLGTEAQTQDAIEELFDQSDLTIRREVSLGRAGRVDFFSDGIAIEVKRKANRRLILGQLDRYAAHEMVTGLILVSATQMNLPPRLHGKPVWFVSLGRAWL